MFTVDSVEIPSYVICDHLPYSYKVSGYKILYNVLVSNLVIRLFSNVYIFNALLD